MIVTDASSRAKITNPKIGTLDLGPESRLTFVAGSPDEQRFSLERGTISASTWVPPRVFVVETPVASAVDLGCEYRLTVGAGGRSLLLVTAGWVELGWNGRSVIVPAAAYCLMRAGPGPGTPFSEYASDTLRQALEQFDFGGGATGALETILAHAGKRDAITLWHLISRVSGQDRPRVSDRLDALVPRPPGVTPEGVLRLDPAMLDRWWDAFEPVPVSTLRERPSPWSAFWSALERLVGT
jgi:hypothetical protein